MKYVLVDDAWEETSFSDPKTDTKSDELLIPVMKEITTPKRVYDV